MAPDTPKIFWNEKILGWEEARYSAQNILNPFSWTVRKRLIQAAEIIYQRLEQGRSVVELGCGSGLLAEKLVGHCGDYFGVDIAEAAIAKATARGLPAEFRFFADDVAQMALPWSDLTVFLGLTDWLSPQQFHALLEKVKSREILFSYTEAYSWSPYRLYRNWIDGKSTEGHRRARSYSMHEMSSMLSVHDFTMEILVKATPLNPGALIWARRI
jgi:cyclopropane fatty-acyl-phospholipid synthase-like methyltransferase